MMPALMTTPACCVRALALCSLLLLAACGGGDEEEGPLRVSVIGPQPQLVIPARTEPDAPEAALLLAAAQGLVSFDAAGQIETGLAERWNVSDDGMSYIFRLRDASWSDGTPVTARQVVAGLRAAVAGGSPNRLAVLFGAIDAIVAVTPQVIEIRLKAPRPLLLPLLAQPELGALHRGQGSGPYRIGAIAGGATLLEPLIPKSPTEAPQVTYPVELRAERAALALVRFKRGTVAAVLGGSYLDLPVARAAAMSAVQLRFDPAQGLFGLAVTAGKDGFLSRADNRNALAMAIDRDAIVALFSVREWRPMLSIVPMRLDMAGDPALPDWASLNRDLRVALARARVTAWANDKGAVPALRIALPAGPGSRLLFARLSADLAAIGLGAVRVGAKDAADLALIDSVSPSDSATWYLRRLACANGTPCSPAGDAALVAARDTLSLAERAARLKEADAAYMANMPFIPIASPMRWSAVAPRLGGFALNARAVHPLGRLLKD